MAIELTSMILGHVIQTKAEASPDKECLIFERRDNPDVHVTYGDMWQNSNKIAALLTKNGVEKGDKFAIMMRNHFRGIYSLVKTQLLSRTNRLKSGT